MCPRNEFKVACHRLTCFNKLLASWSKKIRVYGNRGTTPVQAKKPQRFNPPLPPTIVNLATKGGQEMALGVGNIVALICIVISIIFAIVTHQATNALWWALLAIFAVLWWDARAPWGGP
jgi:hypothetical protein